MFLCSSFLFTFSREGIAEKEKVSATWQDLSGISDVVEIIHISKRCFILINSEAIVMCSFEGGISACKKCMTISDLLQKIQPSLLIE